MKILTFESKIEAEKVAKIVSTLTRLEWEPYWFRLSQFEFGWKIRQVGEEEPETLPTENLETDTKNGLAGRSIVVNGRSKNTYGGATDT